MTDKLKCPFCEYELQENRTTNLCCPICSLIAPTKLWQALIQSQKELKKSQMDDDTYNYIIDAMCWVLDLLDDLSNPDFDKQYQKLDKAIDKFYSWYHNNEEK